MVSISIEKIYKKDHNGNEILITEENQVMDETNRHFQTVAGSVNRRKPIQGRWKEQYKPQPHINENIYSSIMDAPSYDEWLDIIRQLSNGKATGPSGVSNEMLKHLSDDCNHILYYLICKIIELGYLPKQWKEATVFPIAKPKPFNSEIDKQQLGYNVSCMSKSVVQEEGVLNQQNISIMAYMDDTQWITDEKSKLEKMLYIADTFYRLNDIQINKEKSELMMRTTTEKHKYSHNYNDKILIKFGREEINIKAKHPHEPMRILGVYFNIEHDGNYLMFKIKNEIDHLVNLMYKKKITDKHILYIFNRIIVPRVEYWSQVMALSKTQTEALIIPFRRMFKNKLKFARSAPNAILDNPYIYGYRDFYDNQLQAKITDFCIQLNDNGLLGKITEIRLKSLQDQLWTSRPLLEKLPYNRVPHTRKNNYILNMLLLCYDNNISLQNLDNNIFPTIKGGRIPLEDVVDNA
ncbi:unnamed protein product [Rhizophagus irregularis]|nr:unnamed protein product [Rhizophagus irregularis]